MELHRVAVVVAVTRSAKRLGATPGAPWICPLTPAHIGGLLVLLRAAILGTPGHGARAVRSRAPRPRRRGRGVRLGRARDGAAARGGRLGLHGLTLLVGGDGLDDETADAARSRGAHLVTTYGLTETCGGFTYDGDAARRHGRADRPRARSRSPGSTLMEGYRLDPAATGAAFTTDGWLRTGDLGSIDDDGRVTVHGRGDDLISTGAEKVWPDGGRAHPRRPSEGRRRRRRRATGPRVGLPRLRVRRPRVGGRPALPRGAPGPRGRSARPLQAAARAPAGPGDPPDARRGRSAAPSFAER